MLGESRRLARQIPKKPHPGPWTITLGAMVIAVAPTLIVVAAGYANTLTVLAAVALSMVVLCFGAAWESGR
jgi:hypothetical protein